MWSVPSPSKKFFFFGTTAIDYITASQHTYTASAKNFAVGCLFVALSEKEQSVLVMCACKEAEPVLSDRKHSGAFFFSELCCF